MQTQILNKYFQSDTNSFWRIDTSESHKVFVTLNNATIIYADYLVDILSNLAPYGFPPIGCLLLTELAMQQHESTAFADSMQFLHNYVEEFSETYPRIKEDFQNTKDFLSVVNNLPVDFLKGQNKFNVYIALFKNCHNRIGITESTALLKEAQNPASNLIPSSFSIGTNNPKKVLATLSLLKYVFNSPDDIIKTVKRLPNLNLIAEEFTNADLTPVDKEQTIKFNLEELLQNPQTMEMSALIKRLWGGLRIPDNPQLPSGQPLGGVSDINNKGRIEQLLLTEFANEDDLFLTRLANNEALYLEREIPPQQNKYTRIFLIDTTLRNWGTPKLISFASALAIANQKNAVEKNEFYLISNQCIKIDLIEVNQIISALENISIEVNPISGFEDFFKNFYTKSRTEIFYCTSDKSLKSTETSAAVNLHRDKIKYLVVSNELGQIVLNKFINRTKVEMLKLNLPLEELWEEGKKKLPKTKPKSISVSESPLLLPSLPKKTLFAIGQNSYYAIRYDGKIFQAEFEEKNLQHPKLILKKLSLLQKTFVQFSINDVELINLYNRSLIIKSTKNKIDLLYICHATGIIDKTKITTQLPVKAKYSILTEENELLLFSENSNNLLKSIQITVNTEKENVLFHEIEKDNNEINYSDLRSNLYRAKEENYKSVPICNLNCISKLSFIGIDLENQLVLNSRSLTFNSNNEVILKTSYPKTKITGKKKNNGWYFNDTIKIEFVDIGILKIQCLIENSTPIYFTTNIEKPITMVAGDYYCGDKTNLPVNSQFQYLSTEEFQNQYFKPLFTNLL